MMRSGISGRSESSVPSALLTALTIAGAVGTVAISPTLLAPNGPSSPSCSTSNTCTSGMSGAFTMW